MIEKPKNSLFIRYLLPYLIVFVIPTLVFGLFINNTLIKTLRNQYKQNSVQSLNQLMYIGDNYVDQLQKVHQHLLLNKELRVTLHMGDVIVSQNIINELGKYAASNNFIDDMVLYFHGDSYFYSSNSSYSVDAFLNKLSKYPQLDIKNFMVDATSVQTQTIIPLDNDRSSNNSLAVLYPLKFKNNVATLIFFLDITKAYKIDESSICMIFDEKNQLIASKNTPEQLGSAQMEQLKKLSQDGNDSYEEISLLNMDKKYLAASVVSQNTGWKYIYMTPVNKVYGEVTRIQAYFAIILLLVVIISMIVIQISMRTNYKPVSRLQSIVKTINHDLTKGKSGIETIQNTLTYLATENTSLKNTVTRSSKLQFIQQLLKGRIVTKSEFEESVENLGLELLKQSYYYVLIIVFNDETNSAYKRLDMADIERIIRDFVEGYICDHSEKNKYLFIGSMDDKRKRRFSDKLLDIQTSLHQEFNCDIVVASSTFCDSYDKIPNCYLEASLASDYRFIKGNNCVIDSSELVINDGADMVYPQHLFEKLSYQIKEGDSKQVEQILSEIISSIKESKVSLYYAKGLCYQLVNSISNIVSNLNKELIVSRNDISYAATLADFKTVDDLINAVRNICLNVCAYVQSKKSEKEEDIICRMKAYIEDNYHDSNFSVQGMADHFNMTLSAISVFFKNNSNTTIIDYTTNVRMNKAKQLLIETDYSLNEITEAIGYVNTSSFIRKFKAINGITPGQFVKTYKGLENPK